QQLTSRHHNLDSYVLKVHLFFLHRHQLNPLFLCVLYSLNHSLADLNHFICLICAFKLRVLSSRKAWIAQDDVIPLVCLKLILIVVLD
ncbi:MAG: hypothetical protein ACKO96_20800, partial [Flammeovirgaceae bacterium]